MMDRRPTPSRLAPVVLGAVFASASGCTGCTDVRHGLIHLFAPGYQPAAKVPGAKTLEPVLEDPDRARPKIDVVLEPVARKFVQVTDLQFVPGDDALMIVLEKAGTAKWYDLAKHEQGVLFTLDVLDTSEEGLLGLAFHPKYLQNGLLYLNYVARNAAGNDATKIAEWVVPAVADLRTTAPTARRVILEVEQPYQNHNAGQLQFGPDGYLYVGLGDGGWKNDPHDNGQNMGALLGKMLRIDVDRAESGKGYGVPSDNPFVGRAKWAPEIWALGLRNPWRYSFAPDGRLFVGDVGQDTWEEVDWVRRGDNLGWNRREAAHCFPPEVDACPKDGFVDPIFEYGREEGGSVTGGYVALSERAPALRGKLIVGDFLSGRLWALELPKESGQKATAHTLGKFPILPSTFGRDAKGDIYVADYPEGVVYRIDVGHPGSSHGLGAARTSTVGGT